jgi:CBS domain containing-hemolysin-like protein
MHGGIAGRITRADVVDSLLGASATAPEIEESGLATLPHDGSYALMTLIEAEEVYDLPRGENADVETVGGFVFSPLGRPALCDDEVLAPQGQRLRVVQLDGLRVARMRVFSPEPELTFPVSERAG